MAANWSISPRTSVCNPLTPSPKRVVALAYAVAELTYERKTGSSCRSQNAIEVSRWTGRTFSVLFSAYMEPAVTSSVVHCTVTL